MADSLIASAGSRVGLDFETLDLALRAEATRRHPARAIFPGTAEVLDMAALNDAATRCARHLLAEGVAPGDLVGLLAATTPSAYVGLFGAMRAGAAVTILPMPATTSVDAAVSHVRRIIDRAGIRHFVSTREAEPLADGIAANTPAVRVHQPRADLPALDSTLPPIHPDDLAIVQFTSGSTGSPRGVMLPHRVATAGLAGIRKSAEFTPADRIVQWVPLHHDMGLFGSLSHLLGGSDAHLFNPFEFVRDPGAFLRYVSEVNGTIVTGPNFSYKLMLRAFPSDQLRGLDLSSWRLAFNGAEPVSADVVTGFQRRFAQVGLGSSVMYPVYGMAEATLAITFPEPGTEPRVEHVDQEDLHAAKQARRVAASAPHAKAVVAVGRPVAGVEVRVVNDTGEPVGASQLGEIQIRGKSVTPGYFRDAEATEQAFDGEWLRTGDLGFQLDGDLFVAGRRKEMAIVYGRNYFPEDIEGHVREIDGIYHKRCVAFAENTAAGGESLGVVVETELPAEGHHALVTRIRKRLREELGRIPVQVHVVEPRWLTKTTSGKWQRTLAALRIAQQDGRGHV